MGADIDGVLETVPLRDIPLVGRRFSAWNDWLDHPERDAWWRRVDLGDRPAIPGFWVSGWWDLFLRGSITEWNRQPQHPASRLVIGPWSHLLDGEAHGDHNYGPAASAAAQDVTGSALSFLRGAVDGTPVQDGPRVRYFVMGSNEWRTAETWPPEGTSTQRWYLHADRGLDLQTPEPGATPVTYTHDPLEPVPTLGGRNLFQGTPGAYLSGPMEQSRLDDRRDLVRFTGRPLDRSLTVAGDLVVSIVATTTAVDTDWTAKLVDVFPDGRSYNVADGIVRARFRDGTDRSRLLEPGEPNRFAIQLGPTAYSFLPGSPHPGRDRQLELPAVRSQSRDRGHLGRHAQGGLRGRPPDGLRGRGPRLLARAARLHPLIAPTPPNRQARGPFAAMHASTSASARADGVADILRRGAGARARCEPGSGAARAGELPSAPSARCVGPERAGRRPGGPRRAWTGSCASTGVTAWRSSSPG